MSVAWEDKGKYATDIFTKESIKIIRNHDKKKPLFLYLPHLAPHSGNKKAPLKGQAPKKSFNKFKHIKNEDRRWLAALMHDLDDSVGKVKVSTFSLNTN